jgi:hypothetical protein
MLEEWILKELGLWLVEDKTASRYERYLLVQLKSNQPSELLKSVASAVALARILNRTLVLPPVSCDDHPGKEAMALPSVCPPWMYLNLDILFEANGISIAPFSAAVPVVNVTLSTSTEANITMKFQGSTADAIRFLSFEQAVFPGYDDAVAQDRHTKEMAEICSCEQPQLDRILRREFGARYTLGTPSCASVPNTHTVYLRHDCEFYFLPNCLPSISQPAAIEDCYSCFLEWASGAFGLIFAPNFHSPVPNDREWVRRHASSWSRAVSNIIPKGAQVQCDDCFTTWRLVHEPERLLAEAACRGDIAQAKQVMTQLRKKRIRLSPQV